MKSLVRLEDLDPFDFILKWRITSMCNLKCSYCLRTHNLEDYNADKIEADTKQLCEISKKLSDVFDKSDKNNVKIDLIGGEVSLFDLERIFSHLTSDKIKRINITTNFKKDSDYYNSLAKYLKDRNIELSLTCSYHDEFWSIDSYFDKVIQVKDNVVIFCCELVSTKNNQDLCYEFKKRCLDLDVDYMIEADLSKEALLLRRQNLLFVESRKIKKNPRYKATFSDGTFQIYSSRNEFLTDNQISENVQQRALRTRGFYCTNTSNYAYLDFDTFRCRTDYSEKCINLVSIDDFKILEPKLCTSGVCSLCGHQSLWKI